MKSNKLWKITSILTTGDSSSTESLVTEGSPTSEGSVVTENAIIKSKTNKLNCIRGTSRRNTMNPDPAIMTPGTMKDSPQLYSTKAPATTAPIMFPRFVCEFQRPKIVPLDDRGNQLATTTTTAGHPVD